MSAAGPASQGAVSAHGAPYASFADGLLSTGLISDPWVAGAPRFRTEPCVVTASFAAALDAVAEGLAAAVDEACRLVLAEPSLLDDFLALTPCQRLMAQASLPAWHAVARADVFRTADGRLVACELNSDTPTGQAEAIAAGAVARAPGMADGAAALGPRFRALVRALYRALPTPAPAAAGILYPTEVTEDLGLVRLYRLWLEEAGFAVVTGSPYNLAYSDEGGLSLLGTRVGVLVRHYKTDWWGERLPVWCDAAPFSDPSPLQGPLLALARAAAAGAAAVVNPLGSVVSQNKRLLALLWAHEEHLSERARRFVEAHVPYTVRLEDVRRERLAAERELWVLKSDYGCEGDEVLVGRHVSPAEWDGALRRAVPTRWVAQRAFVPEEDAQGESMNYGVFLVAGRAAGLYGRAERGPTGPMARSTAVVVAPR